MVKFMYGKIQAHDIHARFVIFPYAAHISTYRANLRKVGNQGILVGAGPRLIKKSAFFDEIIGNLGGFGAVPQNAAPFFWYFLP
ncbi:hypothetical protein [Luteithermobacter gelatinilyticus]|uniref:hypothetical protein n=1 Tax=Luteithermobacter gelatinilyticus TaxID=2582913 RepID=UPI001105841E|nr:hypothetical protein [Luteithermobacter gelatinilyticus]